MEAAQHDLGADRAREGAEQGVDRAVADGGFANFAAIWRAQAHAGSGHARFAGGALDRQALQQEARCAAAGHCQHQGFQIGVVDFLFLVCQRLERSEHLVGLGVVERIAHARQPVFQGVAAAVLAEHQFRLGDADILGMHDLVGLAMLEHAVLVDAGLVREGVVADDCLVALHLLAGDRLQQARGRIQLAGVNAGGEAVTLLTRAQHHDQFFERGVAGALANAVHGALDLACAAFQRRQRVGDCESEIVVAVAAEDHVVGADHFALEAGEQLAHFFGRAVADGVGHVQRGRARSNRGAEDLDQVFGFGADRILGRKLDVVDVLARQRYCGDRRRQHLVLVHVQLVQSVQRAGRDEGVDARALGFLDGARAGLDIAAGGARQAGNRGAAHFAGNARNCGEIVRTGRREAGLDHVDAKFGQRMREPPLAARVHREPRCLLAVAQAGVEDDDAIVVVA